MANSLANWQDSLNYKLVNRLTRPIRQPGMMKMAMGQNIINRCDRFLNRVPLLNQQMQRWGNNITFSSNDVPIVYAQPTSLTSERGVESREQSFQPTVSGDKSSVPPIQRKVDSSQASSVHIQNTETSSPSALAHPYPLPGGESGRTEDQNRPELNGDPVKLQAKFSDSQTASANPSQTDFNPRSQFDEGTIINQTTTAEEEIPVISPQTISEELESRAQLPLQAKFSDSQTSSANPSQINTNPRSHLDEATIIPQTVTSDLEIPVVAPQISTEKLINPRSQFDEGTIINQTTTAEEDIPVVSPPTLESRKQLPLQAKFSNSPTASVNPSQINFNPRSRSSLPVVNPSNRLVIPQQTQQNNDGRKKSTSIKDKELIVELPAQEFPVVTVQPLAYPMNLAEEEFRNTPNDQNQLFNISRSQVQQNNSQQNIDILPVVPVTSQVNTSSQTRSSPLPLANKSSNSINQKTHQANQNSLGSNTSNTAAASSPKIIASSSPPTQTFVSARETQPKIDLDAITSKVERKIMRRLVIESERRGKIR